MPRYIRHCNQPALQKYSSFAQFILILGLLCILQGCSPSLAPLYRDFEVDQSAGDIYPRLVSALADAGWDTTASVAANTLQTKNRTLNRWLVYKTVASLELIPVGDKHVRVLIHPYRYNFLKMKSKLPYLPSNVARKILPDLTASLQVQGVYLEGNMPADSIAASGK